MNDTELQSEDRTVLRFWDREKVDGILNASLMLVILAIMENNIVYGFLLKDRSSCNVLPST